MAGGKSSLTNVHNEGKGIPFGQGNLALGVLLKLLDENIDVDKHKYALFSLENRFLLILFVITAILDALSTLYFMNKIGPQIEGNYLIRLFAITYGIVIGPMLGKLYQFFALWAFSIIAPRLIQFILSIIIMINTFAFAVNMSL